MCRWRAGVWFRAFLLGLLRSDEVLIPILGSHVLYLRRNGPLLDTALARSLLLAVVGLLSVFVFVGVVFANPLPMDSFWEGKPIQYLSVVFAEFCGLLAGVSVLSYKAESKWRSAVFTVLIAIVVSYAIGVAIWTWGRAAGLLLYNPINPFLNYSPHPLGWFILLLPEFIGTAVGTLLIHVNEKPSWRTSFLTMAAAMVTSFLVGMLLVNAYLHAL